MLNKLRSGVIVASVVFLLSPAAQAASQPHSRAQVRQHERHQPRQSINRHRRHHRPRRHMHPHRQYNHQHHGRHHRHQHHGRHHRHPRHRGHHPHHNIFVGVHIGGHHHPHYPHGHYQHIHDDYCPVIIEPYVDYHNGTESTLAWEVEYYDDAPSATATSVYLILAPTHGDVYINGKYIGHAQSFKHGKKRVVVPPGNHHIQLKTGGRSYNQQVTIKPGRTAVVKAKRL